MLCYVYGWLVYVTVSAVKQYTVAGEGGPGPGGGDLEIRPALTGDLNIRIISKMGFLFTVSRKLEVFNMEII